MSGDRYLNCPRCKAFVDKFDTEIKSYRKTYYGKLDADEYEILCKRLKEIKNPFAQGSSVRIDHESYFDDDGKFKFYSSAHCEVCGLEAHVEDEISPRNQSESQSRFEEEMRKLRDRWGLPEAV